MPPPHSPPKTACEKTNTIGKESFSSKGDLCKVHDRTLPIRRTAGIQPATHEAGVFSMLRRMKRNKDAGWKPAVRRRSGVLQMSPQGEKGRRGRAGYKGDNSMRIGRAGRYLDQSSSLSPVIRVNSRVLAVTSVQLRAMA